MNVNVFPENRCAVVQNTYADVFFLFSPSLLKMMEDADEVLFEVKRITLTLFTLCSSLFLVLLRSHKCFCHSTAMVLSECSACGLFWKLCSLVGFMYWVCCVCLLPVCRFIHQLKSIVFLPSKVYDIQGNLQDGSQVVVSVIFENKCDSFLKSMEFNVLDSLNSKLQRPEGSSPHDGLTVPFQLPPGRWFGKCWLLWMC